MCVCVFTGEYPIEDSKRLCVYLIDQAIRQAQAQGGEQIVGVFDLRGFQVGYATKAMHQMYDASLLAYGHIPKLPHIITGARASVCGS